MSDHPASASLPALTRTPRRGRVEPGSEQEKRLREIWESRPGWRGWFSTVDHKTIGLRYLVTAFIFLLMGGVEALIMLCGLRGRSILPAALPSLPARRLPLTLSVSLKYLPRTPCGRLPARSSIRGAKPSLAAASIRVIIKGTSG